MKRKARREIVDGISDEDENDNGDGEIRKEEENKFPLIFV